MKKEYKKPELVVYGDVETLTLNSSFANKDNPGPNDTAIPNS